jgi:hypothetical protein
MLGEHRVQSRTAYLREPRDLALGQAGVQGLLGQLRDLCARREHLCSGLLSLGSDDDELLVNGGHPEFIVNPLTSWGDITMMRSLAKLPVAITSLKWPRDAQTSGAVAGGRLALSLTALTIPRAFTACIAFIH